MPDARYVHGHHESVLRSHEWRTAENSAAYLLPHLRPGQHLLDIGCGPGTITADLAARVAPGGVLGVDRSAEVVARAGDRFGDQQHLSFRVGDVMALDIADDSFDVVHAHQVLQHVADPVGAIRELRRVCRPDGLLALRDADYAAFAWAPSDPRLDRWLDLYRGAARTGGGEPDAGRKLLAWARAAGCVEVRPGASVWCFAEPEDRSWWADTWSERILESDVASELRDAGIEEGELRSISAAFLEWRDSPDGWWIIPHGEVLARP